MYYVLFVLGIDSVVFVVQVCFVALYEKEIMHKR